MRNGLVIGGLAVALASALYSAVFAVVTSLIDAWSAAVAVLGVCVALVGSFLKSRAGTRGQGDPAWVWLLMSGLLIALVGALWFLSLLNDIETLQHQLTGSGGGFVTLDGVLAVFAATPVTVVGVVLALVGFFIRPPAETM